MPNIFFPTLADTFISEYQPNTNFNGSTNLFVSRYQQFGDIYRSLLLFRLTNPVNGLNLIPPGSIINEAFLQLTISRNELPVGGFITLRVFTALEPWDPALVTFNNQPNFPPVAEATTNITDGLGTVNVNLTNLVRAWFSGQIVNLGIVLAGNEDANSLVGFFSSWSNSSGAWPKLYVNYSSPIKKI
jgi:hypothetical protein